MKQFPDMGTLCVIEFPDVEEESPWSCYYCGGTETETRVGRWVCGAGDSGEEEYEACANCGAPVE